MPTVVYGLMTLEVYCLPARCYGLWWYAYLLPLNSYVRLVGIVGGESYWQPVFWEVEILEAKINMEMLYTNVLGAFSFGLRVEVWATVLNATDAVISVDILDFIPHPLRRGTHHFLLLIISLCLSEAWIRYSDVFSCLVPRLAALNSRGEKRAGLGTRQCFHLDLILGNYLPLYKYIFESLLPSSWYLF